MTPDLDRRLGVRRLTARSVIASTLLGVTPPELPTRSLVGTAELLGIAPGTARVAMSRMVAAGELEASDDGYRLVSPSLLARQARQNRSRAAGGAAGGGERTDRWDGTWHMVVVTGEARPQPERVELRTALLAHRYAELREGVWLRPDELGGDRHGAPSDDHTVDPRERPADGPPIDVPTDGVGRLVGMVVRPEEPGALAASLWDLEAWTDRAWLLLAEVERLQPALDAGDAGALADGFVVSAAVLRHFQADPLLPVDLLPPDWPGPELRRRYDAFDAAFRATLTTWQTHHRPTIG